MVKTQWILLLTTFFISCISLIIAIVAFSTSNWLISQAIHKEGTAKNSQIHYGIFSGSLTRFIIGERHFDLAIVCLFEEYSCMYSCQNTAELREDELRRALSGQSLRPCATSSTSRLLRKMNDQQNVNSSIEILNQTDGNIIIDNEYIDPGLWLTTLISISITVSFAFISAVFAIINIVLNPVEPILSVLGLYIWNGITSAAAVLTLTIWGILFAVSLTENIAITDTLTQSSAYFSDGQASLGFSYWLLCAPALLHILNIGLLLWRKRLIEMEPPPATIRIDKSDMTNHFY